jgi:hypothetical protein
MGNILMDLHKNDEHLNIRSNIENMECISLHENAKSKEKALKHILHVDEKLPNRL